MTRVCRIYVDIGSALICSEELKSYTSLIIQELSAYKENDPLHKVYYKSFPEFQYLSVVSSWLTHLNFSSFQVSRITLYCASVSEYAHLESTYR